MGFQRYVCLILTLLGANLAEVIRRTPPAETLICRTVDECAVQNTIPQGRRDVPLVEVSSGEDVVIVNRIFLIREHYNDG